MAKTQIPDGYVQKAYQIRLYPNNKQETKLNQCVGVARWAYNWGLSIQMENYKNSCSFIGHDELRKQLTQLKKTNKQEYGWLYDYSNNITKQAIKDLCNAYSKFFNIKNKRYTKKTIQKAQRHGKQLTIYDLEGHPKFKSKKKEIKKFYNDGFTAKYSGTHIYLEKIGLIRLAEENRLPEDYRITTVRVKKIGNHWFVSLLVIVKDDRKYATPTNEGLGIDVGIKELAVCSDGKKYKNINKTSKVNKLKKKLRRMQRKSSRKYLLNKQENKFIKTKNIEKLEYNIQSIQTKLNNIKTNYLHQVSNQIVKRKPIFITIEDISVKSIMKNKHLSKAIQEQKLYEFRQMLTYKAKRNGIELRVVDIFYPSSKICSDCGFIKKDLKLSDRIYKCDCGNHIDRDLNASINLMNAKTYKIAT